MRFLQLKARQKPPGIVISNLKAWLRNANNPIHPEEVGFLDAPDLIGFSQLNKSSVRLFLEAKLLPPTKALWGFVSHKSQPDSAADEHTVEWDDDAVSRLANMAVFLAALVMLILPL